MKLIRLIGNKRYKIRSSKNGLVIVRYKEKKSIDNVFHKELDNWKHLFPLERL